MSHNTFVKVRFASPSHQTAGLVFTSPQLLQHNIASLSRLFPSKEFGRLGSRLVRLEMSPEFETFEQAFAHEFASK